MSKPQAPTAPPGEEEKTLGQKKAGDPPTAVTLEGLREMSQEEVNALPPEVLDAALASQPSAKAEESPPPEGAVTPPATGAEAWDAKAWERFGHSLMSAAVHGKDLPKLPEGVTLDAAPEHVRTILGPLYVAEGEKPEVDRVPAKGPEPAEIYRLADIRAGQDYQLAMYEALGEAATREEREAAMAGVDATFIEPILDDAIRALEMGGHDLGLYWKPERTPEEGAALDGALGEIPGLTLPDDTGNLGQVVAFANSVRRYVREKGGKGADPEAAQRAAAEAVEKFTTDLQAYAAGQRAQEGIDRGDLATAAGLGVGGTTTRVPTMAELKEMTQEEVNALPPEVLDAALAGRRTV